MRAFVSVATILGALAVSAACAQAAGPPTEGSLGPEAAEAARVADAFHQAIRQADASAAAAMLDDDAVIFEEGYAEESKSAYVSSHLPEDIAFMATATETVTKRTGQASDGIAWLASQGRVSAQIKDRKIDRVTTETMVLRKSRGQWRIVHVHWSSGAAAQ